MEKAWEPCAKVSSDYRGMAGRWVDNLRAFPRGWMEGHGAVIPKCMDGTRGPGRAGGGRGGDRMGQNQEVQGIMEDSSEAEKKKSMR